MPKFSVAAKQTITTRLVHHAEKLFVQHGLKNTSVAMLADAAGIAVGSFYHFFGSKEALYLEILARQTPHIQQTVWRAVQSATSTRDAIIAYLMTTMNEIDTNPFMRRLITHPQELQMVAKKVPPAFVRQQFAKTTTPLVQYVEQEQQAGRITASLAPESIETAMRGVMAITRHKQEMGEHYETAKQILSVALATELTK